MTVAWTQHLQQAGAQFDEGTLLHFGNPSEEQQSLLTNDVLLDLSQLALIKATGSDAEKFLQGQTTNDVRQVTEQQSQLSSCCSPKGRIIVNFRVFKWLDAYYLLLPQASLDNLLKRLRMYVLRADVQLTNASADLVRIGLAGANSQRLLQDVLNTTPPTTANGCVATDACYVIYHSEVQPCYMLIGSSDRMITVWQKLAASVQPVGSAAWTLFDILAGIPQVTPPVAEEFIPQMLNYQHLKGVDFKKGCYTGQEIVARMQYLGSLKRQMYLARIDSSAAPAVGDSLYVNANQQSIGKIVNVHPHPQGGYYLLAVLQIEEASQETVYLHEPQGTPLELLDLPYALTAD